MEPSLETGDDGLNPILKREDVEAAWIDKSPSEDEASRLRSLAAEVVDQDELERNIARQVSMGNA